MLRTRLSFEIVREWRGVSEETTTGVHRLYKLQELGQLLVPPSLDDSVTKSNSITSMAAGIRWWTGSTGPWM